jgi:hypothetical protein
MLPRTHLTHSAVSIAYARSMTEPHTQLALHRARAAVAAHVARAAAPAGRSCSIVLGSRSILLDFQRGACPVLPAKLGFLFALASPQRPAGR